jgi:hypothetical protein
MSDSVPTRFVRTLLRMVGDKGYDFSVVLNAAGLDFDPLDEADPAYRPEISAMQYSRIYGAGRVPYDVLLHHFL